MGPGSRSLRSLVRDDGDGGSSKSSTEYDSVFSRLKKPEVCIFVCPLKNRGRREDRVRAAPAVSRARCTRQKRTRAYRFSGSIPAFPAQWLYGLLRALPGERLSCHRRPLRSLLLTNLTPASGRQDHTTSPYAQATLVSRCSRVHRIPPHVRDDRDPPLICRETREVMPLICPTG